MTKSFIAIALCSCFLFACSNSTESENNASNTPSDSAVQNAAPAAVDVPAQTPPADHSAVMPEPTATAPNISAPPPPPATATAKGMNPPHGQPGHRCEISVGAPLNSTPTAAPATNAPGTTPSITPVTPITPSATPAAPDPSAPTTTTAPGMNPPHGQPGHDCNIPVGSPLKK